MGKSSLPVRRIAPYAARRNIDTIMTPDSQPQSKSWVRLLALFSIASLVETSFGGQVFAFTPLYLPKLGVAPADVAVWTGAVTSFSFVAGIPFLPFWGALA